LPAIDFEGASVRTLYFASDIQFITTNGIFLLNVIANAKLAVLQQIMAHSANRQWRITNIDNLQISGVFGFTVALADDLDRNIVGIRAYKVGADYRNQIFDETTNSTLTTQTETTWTLNRLGVRSASGEPFRGYMHEMIFFNDYTLCPDSEIINEKIATFK
jgi:hypothetical protein